MRHYITAFILLAGASLVSGAHAQSDGTLSCEELQMPITGIPDNVPLTFTVPADDLIKRCTSEDHSPLTLVTPANGVTVTIDAGTIQIVQFTVKDDNGHQVTSKLTVTRDQGNS